MLRIISTVLMVACTLVACKKDKQIEPEPSVYHYPETLKPLSYYPMFPGSYWIYLDQKGDSVKFFTDNTYKKHYYKEGIDTVFVPFLKGPQDFESKAIYQYDVISEFSPWLNGKPVREKTPYISETVGKQFKRGGLDSRYPDHRTVFKVKEKVKLNNDSVLVITGAEDYNSHIYIEFYTKNVGLTWRCTLDTISKDTIERLSLVKYHVNK